MATWQFHDCSEFAVGRQLQSAAWPVRACGGTETVGTNRVQRRPRSGPPIAQAGCNCHLRRTRASEHHHSRSLDGFVRECLARGGAIATLEARWGYRPPQLKPLVTICPGYNRVTALIQGTIGRRDRGGFTQGAVVAVYRMAGVARVWRVQDAATRLLRRAIIMRGYRIATVRQGRPLVPDGE